MQLREVPGYVFDELRAHYDNREWWRDRFIDRVVRPIHINVYPRRTGSTWVMEQDWDTLIVLDACRADLFESVVDLSLFDAYRQVISPASATKEWVNENFAGGSWGDTVYVSGNPYVSREASDVFHELIEVWRESFDKDAKTVLPEQIVSTALAAREQHEDKRLIVHFMQPHHPFIATPELVYNSWDVEAFSDWDDQKKAAGLDDTPEIQTPWEALEMGILSREEVWNAYAENLEIAMEQVMALVKRLDGRTIITSDHGNLFGEYAWPFPIRQYGHPHRVRVGSLTRVPWAELTNGNRLDIVAGGIHSQIDTEERQMKERLAHLGYHE